MLSREEKAKLIAQVERTLIAMFNAGVGALGYENTAEAKATAEERELKRLIEEELS